MSEKINSPAHYGGPNNLHETWKCLAAWGLVRSAYLWNAVKYLSRAGKKGGESAVTDIGKARWYLEAQVCLLEGREPSKIGQPEDDPEDYDVEDAMKLMGCGHESIFFRFEEGILDAQMCIKCRVSKGKRS